MLKVSEKTEKVISIVTKTITDLTYVLIGAMCLWGVMHDGYPAWFGWLLALVAFATYKFLGVLFWERGDKQL